MLENIWNAITRLPMVQLGCNIGGRSPRVLDMSAMLRLPWQRPLPTNAALNILQLWVVLCDTWNWSEDNDTASVITILDTTTIPEMRSAISVSFRIRQSQYSVYSQTVAVIKIVCIRVCTALWHAVTTYTAACSHSAWKHFINFNHISSDSPEV